VRGLSHGIAPSISIILNDKLNLSPDTKKESK